MCKTLRGGKANSIFPPLNQAAGSAFSKGKTPASIIQGSQPPLPLIPMATRKKPQMRTRGTNGSPSLKPSGKKTSLPSIGRGVLTLPHERMNFTIGDLIYGLGKNIEELINKFEFKNTDTDWKHTDNGNTFTYRRKPVVARVNPLTDAWLTPKATSIQGNKKQKRDFFDTFNSIPELNQYLNGMNKKDEHRFRRTSKAGIIHTYKIGHTIYYLSEGITINDIFDNNNGYYNSITSTELRFIYRNRDILSNTVKFIDQKGNIIDSPWGNHTIENYEKKRSLKKQEKLKHPATRGFTSFGERLEIISQPTNHLSLPKNYSLLT